METKRGKFPDYKMHGWLKPFRLRSPLALFI